MNSFKLSVSLSLQPIPGAEGINSSGNTNEGTIMYIHAQLNHITYSCAYIAMKLHSFVRLQLLPKYFSFLYTQLVVTPYGVIWMPS